MVKGELHQGVCSPLEKFIFLRSNRSANASVKSAHKRSPKKLRRYAAAIGAGICVRNPELMAVDGSEIDQGREGRD